MIDEAFFPFQEIIRKLTSFNGTLEDKEESVRSYIYEFSVETPLELDVVVDDENWVHIGSTPPIYDVDTSFRPSFHNIRFTAVLTEDQ